MKKIAVEQFAILVNEYPRTEITLNTDLTFQYSLESRQVACKVAFRFCADDSVCLVLVCKCDFLIAEDDWRRLVKGNGIAIPKSLMEILAVHTIGTARGILFCKTEGTPFNTMMIPPINVEKMMESEPAEIESGN